MKYLLFSFRASFYWFFFSILLQWCIFHSIKSTFSILSDLIVLSPSPLKKNQPIVKIVSILSGLSSWNLFPNFQSFLIFLEAKFYDSLWRKISYYIKFCVKREQLFKSHFAWRVLLWLSIFLELCLYLMETFFPYQCSWDVIRTYADVS